MTGSIELPAAGQPSAGTARNRGISYHGNLGRVLRDLTGFTTLMFELLQNADDAGATTMRIDVGQDALVVVNNAMFSDCGNQDFPPEDCRPASASITRRRFLPCRSIPADRSAPTGVIPLTA